MTSLVAGGGYGQAAVVRCVRNRIGRYFIIATYLLLVCIDQPRFSVGQRLTFFAILFLEGAAFAGHQRDYCAQGDQNLFHRSLN